MANQVTVNLKTSKGAIPFDEVIMDPKKIAQTIDQWYNADISMFSLDGKEFAKKMSWEVLKPRYMETLSEW